MIAEKETDEDEESIEYLTTNEIDAPTEQVSRSYGMVWRIGTVPANSTQDLGL